MVHLLKEKKYSVKICSLRQTDSQKDIKEKKYLRVMLWKGGVKILEGFYILLYILHIKFL